MLKGMRVFLTTIVPFLLIATLFGEDRTSNGAAAAAPPVAPQKPVVDTIQNHRIVDPYRWLEDSASPETQKWVSEELTYTRGLLDPLPGRDQLHKRLSELMSIGTLSAPQLGGPHYFYTKREGTQNQPVLLVRKGVHGADRALLDVNQLAADGTVARQAVPR
ncbi:MAG: hypothetical protein DMG97_39220 [Acidobacteria bacterium]|nr:MAG: hypothetical protein DMG97_39220 [Acidobacteriota bacterium]